MSYSPLRFSTTEAGHFGFDSIRFDCIELTHSYCPFLSFSVLSTWLRLGASSGIGAVTARRLAAEGAKVVLFARREDKLALIVNAIRKSGGEASYLVGDASSEEDNKKLVDFAVKQYGAVHIAFNNAGAVRGYGQKPWEISAATFSEQMATNVNSIFFAVKYQAPAISHSGGGAIVNNASVVAFPLGMPSFSIYPASKTWVLGYTQHVATDLAKIGVRINTVSPGPTFSDVFGAEGHGAIENLGKTTAIGRAIKPEEIAASVAFLASDEAQAITGIDLIIDAGVKVADKANAH